jgi:hypothetical protein
VVDTTPGRAPAIEERGGGTARIESETIERLRVATSSQRPGLLVLARAWLPLYRATIDGAPAATLQANFGQLAIEVPAGEHSIEIWIDRRPFQAALAGTALGALGLCAVAFAGGRGRDQPGAACQPSEPVKESVG